MGVTAAGLLYLPTCFVAGLATGSWVRGDEISVRVMTPLPFIGAGIGFLIGLAIDIREARDKAEAERKRTRGEAEAKRRRREAEALAREAEKQNLRNQITNLNEESLGAFEQIPIRLRSAEEYLDKAEIDFAKGSFVPFWESVERATVALGGVEERVRQIERNSLQYIDVVKAARKYEIKAPAFPVSSTSAPRLRLASETSKRMTQIVDQAHCNFQFSQTYLQIRTNQIPVAGFKNLARALEEMTWRITQSIDDLSTAVNATGAKLDDSPRKLHEQGKRIADATERLPAEAASNSTREQKALEMLNNIQRNRYPSFIHGGLM